MDHKKPKKLKSQQLSRRQPRHDVSGLSRVALRSLRGLQRSEECLHAVCCGLYQIHVDVGLLYAWHMGLLPTQGLDTGHGSEASDLHHSPLSLSRIPGFSAESCWQIRVSTANIRLGELEPNIFQQ